MKKKWGKKVGVVAVIASLAGTTLFSPLGTNEEKVSANSNSVQRLEREIQQLKDEQKQLQGKRNDLKSQINTLENEKKEHQADIMALDLQLNETQRQMDAKEAEITQTEEEAKVAALELVAAEERVAERDQLLKQRIRAMYESGGSISYLEVLLGSAHFGEFLERLDFLGLIVEQDQKILDDFIRDKELIEQKKLEIENLLVRLEGQLEDLEELKSRQQMQQDQLRLLVVKIKETQEELLEIDQEIQQEMLNYANKQKALQSELNKLSFDGVFTWPVPSSQRITSHFGLRDDPFTGKRAGHSGTDIGAPQGTTIVAAADGVVTVAEYINGYGNAIIIEHGNNTRTLYGHIRHGGIMVKPGERVKRGQKIAEVGSTGRSTGPHLHFEVHEQGKQVDPMKYLKK